MTALLDGLTGVTGAWSMSRNLLSAYSGAYYTDTGADGTVDFLLDQTGSGSAKDFIKFSVSSPLPTLATAGANNRACLRFNGADQRMTTSSIASNFLSVTDGYMVASFVPWDITTNAATDDNNDIVLSILYGGISLINGGGTAYAVRASNLEAGTVWRSTPADTIVLGTANVYEWWHTGGVLYGRLNAGTTRTVGSSDTVDLNAGIRLGTAGSGIYTQIDIAEMAVLNTVPSSGQRDALVAGFWNWLAGNALAAVESPDTAALAGPVTKTFFDPLHKSSAMILTNTNLTATRVADRLAALAVIEAPDLVAITDASNIEFVAGTTAGSTNDGASVTTAAIDSTGANFLVVAVADYGAVSPGTVTDSKGNTWSILTSYTELSDSDRICLFYSKPTSVGSGHTASYAAGGVGYPSVGFAAFKNVGAAPFDKQVGATGSSPAPAGGWITPASDNSLIIAAQINLAATDAVGSGFSMVAAPIPLLAAQHYGLGMAYLIQTAASAVNPVWTTHIVPSGDQGWAATNAVFKQ